METDKPSSLTDVDHFASKGHSVEPGPVGAPDVPYVTCEPSQKTNGVCSVAEFYGQ